MLKKWLLCCVLVVQCLWPCAQARERAHSPDSSEIQGVAVSQLPVQARETLALIRRGGPFHHSQDGATFGNRESRLPKQPRGYYTEYTVKTPGARDRGARRIIAGGLSGQRTEFFYTADHYRSFQRIRE